MEPTDIDNKPRFYKRPTLIAKKSRDYTAYKEPPVEPPTEPPAPTSIYLQYKFETNGREKNSVIEVENNTNVNGWKLVRYLPENSKYWHPVNDNLSGLIEYSDTNKIDGQTHTIGSWSILFGTFNEFFIIDYAVCSGAF